MDPSNADTKDGVMIALLPTSSDWCNIELPHLTLVYAGTTADLKTTDFNELAKDAASLAMLSRPIFLRVLGVEVFGDTEKVNALKLQPSSELWAMRRFVEDWNASSFPFNPHCTIGPPSSPTQGYLEDPAPRALGFDRIYVGFGEQNLTFLMNGARTSSY